MLVTEGAVWLKGECAVCRIIDLNDRDGIAGVLIDDAGQQIADARFEGVAAGAFINQEGAVGNEWRVIVDRLNLNVDGDSVCVSAVVLYDIGK